MLVKTNSFISRLACKFPIQMISVMNARVGSDTRSYVRVSFVFSRADILTGVAIVIGLLVLTAAAIAIGLLVGGAIILIS